MAGDTCSRHQPSLARNQLERDLANMEQRFKEAKLRNNSSGDIASTNVVQDDEMAARIALAKLASKLYIALLRRGLCGLLWLDSCR